MFITATLPENFAYIMRSFNYELTVDTVTDWNKHIALRLFNHIPGQPVGTSETIHVQTSDTDNAGTNPAAAVHERGGSPLAAFAGPIWAVHGGAITFRVHASNIAAAVQAAGFVITHCEFLEYDLNQAQRYFINTPIPTIAR